jgi:putative RecB family exonuclease
MVPPEMRQEPHVSYTQLDQYLRCPLKYRFQYVDRLEPEFVPVALGFGSGIHGAAAFFYRGVAQGRAPSVADVQSVFETMWNLETGHRPVRFGEKDTKDALLDLGRRMLAVLCAAHDPAAEVLAVEEPFRVPLIDPETGEILDRDLVGTLDRLEKDADGRVVVVDLKTAARTATSRSKPHFNCLSTRTPRR